MVKLYQEHSSHSEAPAPPDATVLEPRWRTVLNLVIFVISTIAIVIVINFFAQREPVRQRIDATKTRAYSLSAPSQKLLDSLSGQWTISLIMSEQKLDRAARLQIDEVAKRYGEASRNVHVRRISPNNPLEFDAALAQLRDVYKEPIAEYDQALDEGEKAFAELQLFAQQQSPILEQAAGRMPEDDPDSKGLKQRAGLLGLLADQGGQVTDMVRKSRRIDGARPIPDYETARSVLAQSLSQWAGELDEIASVFSRWQERPNFDASVRQFATIARQDYQQMAQKLVVAADPLKRLPQMELSAIGSQLESGEGALIVGPKRAAMIPAGQLFPKSNMRNTQSGGVDYDVRFRGEHLISATIRSLLVERMPLIVFVHADESSMLRPRDKQADLVGVARLLNASRYEIAEWLIAGPQRSVQPTPGEGQVAVWVIIPPAQRAGLQMSKNEQVLLAATAKLIDDGHPVLLSVYPSLMPRYGQPDPWSMLLQAFGMEPRTAQVIYEQVRTDGDLRSNRINQLVNHFSGSHVIARAVEGQDTRLSLPVALRLNSTTKAVQQWTIAAVEPSDDRWLESQWNVDPTQTLEKNAEQELKEPAPVIAAAQREKPGQRVPQRVLLVGAGGWMLSYESDLVVPIGGNRTALVYPGNNDLMLASAAWLAGMDDLVAASPLSQDVARLRDVSPLAWTAWLWITIAGIPGACIGMGIVMWFVRRK